MYLKYYNIVFFISQAWQIMASLVLIDNLKIFYQMDFASIIKDRIDMQTVGSAMISQMYMATSLLTKNCYTECLDLSEAVIDFIWEKLNQGHWKDVSIDWRHSYTILSALKALSEYAMLVVEMNEKALLSEHEMGKPQTTLMKSLSVDFSQVMKTCDMGLLMGAPVEDNILSKLSSALQKDRNEQFIKYGLENFSKTDAVSSSLNKRIVDDDDDDNDDDSFSDRKKKVKINIDRCVNNLREDRCVERRVCPSIETFTRDYFSTQTPVIITQAMDGWPALSSRKWTLDYIKHLAGCRTVPIEIGTKYTDDSWSQKLMTVQEFIQKYIEQKSVGTDIGYLAQHQLFNQIPELQNDLIIPDYCYLGDSEDVDINAWFGPQGTVSPLHYDPKHNFLSQVIGEKYICIFPASETDKLYPHDDTLLKNTSQVDVENPDNEQFPLFSEALYQECVLKSGEMLYMPPKYWHYVKSLTVSFSVSFWWE